MTVREPGGAGQGYLLDPRVRRYVMPTRVVWQSEGPGGSVENSEALLQARAGQATLDNRDGCALRTDAGPAGLLLDFGRELSGGAQLIVSATEGNGPVRVRVRFGESVGEAMAEPGGPGGATNDHAVRDQTCLIPWLGSQEIGNTGFRFVRIDLVDPGSFVLLKAVRGVFLYRDLPYAGSFRCSDDRLNHIWAAGAYTVHLNMQDYLWDGVKRDRLVWIGDMHPEAMTISSVFGTQDIVPASLDLIREETPLPRWMNGISSYSLWWVLIHQSWYLYHGSSDYLEEQRSYLAGLLRQLLTHIGQNDEECLSGGRFLDWPSSGNEQAIHAGLHALLVMTLEAGASLCDVLDEGSLAAQCSEGAARLRRHVPGHGGSKQAAALMALAGLGDAATLNRDVMAVDGAARMSTFYGYYVLQARAKAGDIQGCLDCIRQYWGAMLDRGATTFWEDFDLDWLEGSGRIDELTPEGLKDIHGDYGAHCYKGFRHSLCHGWASGPTAWLSEHVLGIQVLEPGCAAVRVAPALGDLKWAEGTFPTPAGILSVRHERGEDGQVHTSVHAPESVKIMR